MTYSQYRIYSYDDFVQALLECGFTGGGGNPYSLIGWSWQSSPPYDTPVLWHTGDADTDPWQWRMRVLCERRDIVYGKFLRRQSAYITQSFLAPFISVRTGGMDAAEAYCEGRLSHGAKLVYDALCKAPSTNYELRALTGLESAHVDKALLELMDRLYIAICSHKRKLNAAGQPYGWYADVFCPMHTLMSYSALPPYSEALSRLCDTLRTLSPSLTPAQVLRLIKE